MGAAGARQSAETVVKIHITRSFSRDVATLKDALGREADIILDQLFEAFDKLKAYRWDESLPIKPYGNYGDSYSYDFCQDYSFSFKIITDRDEHKTPLVEHYYVKNLLRRR